MTKRPCKQKFNKERKHAHDLQLYSFTVELNRTDLEVNADCGDEGRRPCIVAEPEQEAGFSDTYKSRSESHIS